jgi:hypothetical protein
MGDIEKEKMGKKRQNPVNFVGPHGKPRRQRPLGSLGFCPLCHKTTKKKIRQNFFPPLSRPEGFLSLYTRQDTVQLVQVIVVDHQLALALGTMLKHDLGRQLFTQLILQTFDVRIQ